MNDVSTLSPDSAAARITRGVRLYFEALGHVCLTEFTLSNRRRADVIALSAAGEITIVEVKSGLPDYRADAKWPEYVEFCDSFFFAVDPDFPQTVLPEGTGLLVSDGWQAVELRPAPMTRLVAARRKAMTLRFARTAAERLRAATSQSL